MNENESTMYQNLWGAAIAVLMGNFAALNDYLEKKEYHK